jgi:uncharacterized protein
MTTGLDSLMRQLAAQKHPPVESWDPPFCGDIDMRIAADGSWYYMGTPIGRPALVKLFASVLRRDSDGAYFLVTPVEKVGIKVDDAPFIAVAVECEGQGSSRKMMFRTNVEDVVLASNDNALVVKIDPVTQAPRPYVHVRRGLNALVARSVFYELADIALSEHIDGMQLGLWSAGAFFPFGDLKSFGDTQA